MCRLALLLLLAPLVTGCGSKRIDGSTEETFQTSYEQVLGALDESERERFEEAVRVIGVADLRNFSEDGDADAATRSMLSRLDGMTAQEIIAEAEALQKQR